MPIIKTILFVIAILIIIITFAFIMQCTDTGHVRVDWNGVEWVRKHKLDAVDNRGLSSEMYYVIKGSYEFTVYENINIDSLRSEAIAKLIRDEVIRKQNKGRWYRYDDLDRLLENSKSLYNDLINRSGAVDGYFVLFDHTQRYDKKKEVYVYEPIIYIPKERYARYPESVRVPLNKCIDSMVGEELSKLDDEGEVVLILSGIEVTLDNFRINAEDKKKVNDILAYAPKNIRSFMDDIFSGQKGFSIKNFPNGKYEMEGNMLINLKGFVKSFLKIKQPGYKYDLTCVGYSDKRPVRNRIKYSDKGNLRLPQGVMEQYNIADNDYKDINNNLELSIARAYEGAKIIFDSLDNGLLGIAGRDGINIYYSGGGVYYSEDYSAARRIKVKITKKEY